MILNWPPSRGPKPPDLDYTEKFHLPPVARAVFRFRHPRWAIDERKALVETALDEKYKELGGKDKKPLVRFVTPRQSDRPEGAKYPKHWEVDCHVQTLSTLTLDQASRMIYGVTLIRGRRSIDSEMPVRPVVVSLTYPLSLGVRLRIRPYVIEREYGNGYSQIGVFMDLGYVLWRIAREYQRIYEQWQRFKVWGHAFDTLYFENALLRKSGRFEVEVVA